MKGQKMLVVILAVMFSLTITAQELRAQTTSARMYQQMTQTERAQFVASQARRVASEMSGREYEFTPAFIEDIQQSVNQYTRRIGHEGNSVADKRDLRLVVERGQIQAPALVAAFRARNVSPLIGLYLPWIESEYINNPPAGSMGAIGMFQFLPKTGERFGLSAADLLDVEKSADAAARYITGNLEQFKDDPMKEALALLAYNRGEQKTARDLKALVTDQNKQCSICVLTAERGKLDETFRRESVYYVPRFFAAAIIGENPQAFGLQGQALSAR
ncbi:MAG TPA: transglycosylase SLT domain-containing protein [Pyrinomonadaceae bacterium]|nr:transglycosylase SLT domain-containing protein [Pyrinomonadaceae bacterium]